MASGRYYQGYGHGWNHHRSRRSCRFPAQYHPPVPFHLLPRGFGVHGPDGLHGGPDHAQGRAARKILHPFADRFWLQRSGHHGNPDHRRRQEPAADHADHPVHVLQCSATGICAVYIGVFPGLETSGAVLPLYDRHPAGMDHCCRVRKTVVQKNRKPLCDGIAAIQAAHPEGRRPAYVVQDLLFHKKNLYLES